MQKPIVKTFTVSDEDFKTSTDTNYHKAWCVEVAIKPQGVAIRDSKNRAGGTLFFTNNEFQAFLNGAKRGEFEVKGRVSRSLKR